MSRRLLVVLTFVLCASFATLAQAPPSADAYVTTAQPATNFGTSSLLAVQAGTTSFVRFDLGALPQDAHVAKATLRLYVNAVAAPGLFDVYQVDSGWTENAINHNNTPALGTSATLGRPIFVTAASSNQFILIDITGLAQGWLDGSVSNYGIALASTSSTGSFAFDSKESTGTGHQPELEVVLADTVVTPTGSAAMSTVATTSNGMVSGLSDPYVDNGTALQIGANFNIGGNGSATSFNATSTYLLAGTPVLGSNGSTSFFVGPGAGQSNAGSENTFVGVSAGQANAGGVWNTFVGAYSGVSNTSGNYNSFVGNQSGRSNTTGSWNNFFGTNSGYANTTGSWNSFMGTGSGRSNTTGSQNSFIGMQSGYSNTTGDSNTFVGMQSGYLNTSGRLLTFMGTQSGFSNTTGNYNTFLGTSSGYSNTTGGWNTFIGTNAGYTNSSGNWSIFVGTGSGRFNTTGSSLAFLGMQAGYANTTGSYNSFVGNYSGFNNTTGSNNTFVGFNAGLNAAPAANNNIYVSSLGGSSDSGTIRIGDPASQTAAYIAGISGASTSSGVPVFVDANGKLGTGGGSVSFSQMTGTVTSPQLTGTYTNPVVLSNTSNAITGSFNGTFTGNGAGLTGVMSGLNWPVVPVSSDYNVQISDFATPTTRGNFLILRGTQTHTFTLPNPPPPDGSCVAIGNAADAGINSGTNVYLRVTPNGVNMDTFTTGNSVLPTMPRHTSYLYCSDGTNYFRLGHQQNGVSEIGPWLYTVDTGVVNALKTTFRNGMDFGLIAGNMIFLLPVNANTSATPTLDVNGLGAKKIVKYSNQGLSAGDLSTTALALLIYDGQFWELINPQTAKSTLTGITGTIGGTALTAGSCTSGNASVTGAAVGHPVSVSASDGSLPSGATILSAAVTAINTVTVQLCAVADMTPPAKTYNVSTQ